MSSNRRYYGVRYAKGCHPDELWQTYFTSSKYVIDLIKRDGTSAFTYEVRKTFNDVKKALDWEHQVLIRLHVTENDGWINKTDNSGVFIDDEVRRRMSISARKPKSEETRQRMRKPKSEEHRKILAENSIRYWTLNKGKKMPLKSEEKKKTYSRRTQTLF